MKQGILPSCWGNSFWLILESMAYIYDPLIDKEYYYNFFSNLGHLLPCEECREHYSQIINNDKINGDGLLTALDSNETFFRWVYDLHNQVNRQLNVPESKWPSYETVKNKYSNYKADCSKVPGLCLQNDLGPQKKIILVEQFGSFNDEQWPFIVSTVILVILLLLCLVYIAYLKKKLPSVPFIKNTKIKYHN
jgi:hypothetical protein